MAPTPTCPSRGTVMRQRSVSPFRAASESLGTNSVREAKEVHRLRGLSRLAPVRVSSMVLPGAAAIGLQGPRLGGAADALAVRLNAIVQSSVRKMADVR